MEMAGLVGNLKRRVLGGKSPPGCGVSAKGFHAFNGEDLLREHLPELASRLMCHFFERRKFDIRWNFEIQAGYRLISDAAGIDELEVAKFGGHVECESVRGYSARDVYADGADFAFAGRARVLIMKATPYAGEPGDATGADAINAAEADQSLFHHSNEIHRAETTSGCVLETAEVEDGIANQLAGAMIRDVATTVDFVQGNAATGEELVGSQDVGTAGIAAKGEHRGMFKQEKGVLDEAFESQGGNFGLEPESIFVADTPQVEVLDHGSLIVWIRTTSVLRSRFKDTRKVRPHAKKDKQPENADNSGQWKSGRRHGYVGEIDIHDDGGQNGQGQRDVPVDEQQDAGSDLEETNGDIVVGSRESSREVGERARGDGRCGQKVEQAVRTEEDEDDSQQVARNR